jgi:hypothetical protein
VLRVLVVSAVAAFALVAGFAGTQQYTGTHPGLRHGFLNTAYYVVQLFALSSPPVDQGHDLPVLLSIARFVAPAVTVCAFAEAGRQLFAAELARFRTSRSAYHDVVCGSGAVATAIAVRLAGQGRTVVRVRSLRAAAAGYPQPRAITGDPADAGVLRAAGLPSMRRRCPGTGNSP